MKRFTFQNKGVTNLSDRNLSLNLNSEKQQQKKKYEKRTHVSFKVKVRILWCDWLICENHALYVNTKWSTKGEMERKKNLIWNLKRKGISLLSEFEKVWERYTLKELGNQANFELELINAIYAADIGLSCQLHTILYMDWILSANQSFQCKSNLQ